MGKYFWGHSLGQLRQYVVGEKEGSPASQPVWELRKTEQPSLTSLCMPGTLHQWAPALTHSNATGIQIVSEIADSGGMGETRGQEREPTTVQNGWTWLNINFTCNSSSFLIIHGRHGLGRRGANALKVETRFRQEKKLCQRSFKGCFSYKSQTSVVAILFCFCNQRRCTTLVLWSGLFAGICYLDPAAIPLPIKSQMDLALIKRMVVFITSGT